MVLGEAKILESTLDLTLISGGNLRARNSLGEGGRTADKNLDIVGRRSKQVLLKVLLGDVTSLTLPRVAGLVDKEVELELFRVLGSNLLELLLEDNVIISNVTVEQVDLGLVSRVLVNGMDELVKRGDTRATTNEANLGVLVSGPGVLGNGALEGNSIAILEGENVVAKLASLVALNHELESANVIEIVDRSVRADDIVTLGCNVLGKKSRGRGKAELLASRKLKSEFSSLKF